MAASPELAAEPVAADVHIGNYDMSNDIFDRFAEISMTAHPILLSQMAHFSLSLQTFFDLAGCVTSFDLN